MGYEEALEAAGAEVLEFKEFGSYQGDWWAKVRYNGQEGWVTGSYGSCSGCDAFESEFDCSEFWYEDSRKSDKYKQKLAEFGKTYLNDIFSQGEAEEWASRNIDWDMDAEGMLAFIKDKGWW